MKKVFIIARHEYWVNVRRPDFIIFTSLVPLLGIVALVVSLFFGRQAGGALVRMFDSGPKQTAVVDRSGRFTPILARFEEEYVPYSDEAEARKALENEDVHRVVVVPSSYPDEGDVSVVTAGSRFSPAATSRLRTFFVSHLAEEISDETLRARMIDPYNAQVEYISEGSSLPAAQQVRYWDSWCHSFSASCWPLRSLFRPATLCAVWPKRSPAG